MELFSPKRPQASPDRPALVPAGSAVPGIYVWPTTTGSLVELRVFLPTGPNNFSPFYVEIDISALAVFFADFRNDPEAAFESYFGWKRYVPRPVAKGRPVPPAPKPPANTEEDDSFGLI